MSPGKPADRAGKDSTFRTGELLDCPTSTFDPLDVSLRLRNPHSVLAAFDTRPNAVAEVRLASGPPAGAWARVVERAERSGVPVVSGGPHRTGRRPQRGRAESGGRSTATEAVVKERPPVLLEQLLAGLSKTGAQRGLWLALDRLQDPHNVGAIFRTAAFFGVRGIVLTRDRSAPLSAAVYDVAAGGLEHVSFAVETNLSRVFERAKQAGLWVLGASEHAAEDVARVPRDRPWLLVLGNEEQGLRRLTFERCDALCRLTPRGAIASLNVSVAAAILMASLSRDG
jgi:23S rRNA (guanosine2251-2'-O)-methyltransferase